MDWIDEFIQKFPKPIMLNLKSYEDWVSFDNAWTSRSLKHECTKKEYLLQVYLRLTIDKSFDEYLNIVKASISRAKRRFRGKRK